MSVLFGSPLITMPSTPGPRDIQWSANDINGAIENPFTGQQQIQSWQASWLAATVTMPPMPRSSAAAWIAFLLAAQGMNAVFYFGDLLGAQPQGAAEGAPVTVGSAQSGYVLTTTGWTASQANCLAAGDYLQVGYRLYRSLGQVASDSAGNASINIWPQLRESPPAGTSIVTVNTQGLFRMAANQRSWSESYLRTYGMSFQIREAI